MPTSKILFLKEGQGGINPGDQLFIRNFIVDNSIKTVLEIGTHLGASGLAILDGLDLTGGICFHTVDVLDVNSTSTKKYDKYKPEILPKDIFNKFKTPTTFFSKGSDVFFAENKRKYDLIFVDGAHSKALAKKDIWNALKAVAVNGHIILHDYFPEGKPIWEGKIAIMGVYEAVEELIAEGVLIDVFPLNELAYETKCGGKKTSLALLRKK